MTTDEPRRPWPAWGLIAAIAGCAIALSLWGTAIAPSTNPDSGGYVCGGQILLEKGALLICGTDQPFVWLAPFYSVLLAIADFFGLWRLEGARVICALSFSVSTLLIGAILFASTSSLTVAILGELLFMTSSDLVLSHIYAMSEAPFVVFLLLFILCGWRALEDSRLRWLIGAAAAAALASLTRYAGTALIVAGAIAFACADDPSRLRDRFKRSAVFLLAASAPLGLWLGRNLHVANSLTQRHLGFYPLESWQYRDAATTVVRWFVPLSREACLLTGAPLILAMVVGFATVVYRRSGKLRWFIGLVGLCYLADTVASRLFFDPYIDLSGRILVPFLVCLLILLLVSAHALLDHPAVARRWQMAALLAAVFWVLMNSVGATRILNDAHRNGGGLSSRRFRDSSLLASLADLPATTLIYSNQPEPIYFFSGRIVQFLPTLRGSGANALIGFAAQLRQMRSRLQRQGGLIVYFSDSDPYRAQVTARPSQIMGAGLSIRPVFQSADGVIYEVRADPDVPG